VFNGRFGPYVKRGTENRSVPADISASAITYAQAEVLLAQPAARRGRAAPPAPLKELGADPVSGGAVKVLEGKWGFYVTDGETNANLPKGADLNTLSLPEAAELLEARRGMAPKKKKGGFRKAPAPGTARVVGKGASGPAKKAAAKKTDASGDGEPKAAAKPRTPKKPTGKSKGPV
jgi:DNA topoisomerase-1